MRDIVDVIKEDIVEQIDNTVKVKTIVESGPNIIKFTLCDYKWLKEGRSLRSETDLFYQASFIDADGVITAQNPGAALEPRQILTLPPPVFIHGTHRVANQEWLKSVNSDIRLGVPLIWLVETIPGERYPKDHAQDFDALPRLFFLDETNPIEDLNPQQRQQGVKPMLALVTAFYEAVDESFEISRNRGAFERTISRFGTEDKEGMIQNILSAHLGGVEIRPTITISKDVRCTC